MDIDCLTGSLHAPTVANLLSSYHTLTAAKAHHQTSPKLSQPASDAWALLLNALGKERKEWGMGGSSAKHTKACKSSHLS